MERVPAAQVLPVLDEAHRIFQRSPVAPDGASAPQFIRQRLNTKLLEITRAGTAPGRATAAPKTPSANSAAGEPRQADVVLDEAVYVAINDLVDRGMLTRENIVASSLMSHLATLPSDVALQALAEVKGYKGSANPGKLVVFTADQILHQRKEGLYPSAQGHMHAWRMLFFCMGEVCSSSSAHMQNV
jgi:hypothetical protein